MRNTILRKKRFSSIQNKIPKDLYNRLLNRKRRVVEEDTKLRENLVQKLCEVDTKEGIERILKAIEPFSRNKRKESLLMGGPFSLPISSLAIKIFSSRILSFHPYL